jgi:hypothetical protein
MTFEPDTPSQIGWLRAILTTAVIALVAIAVLVYGTNAVLTNIHGKTRGSLVAVATIMFFGFLLLFAWGLRQLQRRKII